MKNILIPAFIIVLIAFSTVTFSQRNANQVNFKKQSNKVQMEANFDILDNDDELFQISTSNESSTGYSQNSYGGIKQYVRDNEIIFEVRTLMNKEADRFLAVFNLTQIGDSASITDRLINARIEKFVNGIKKLGLSDEDIYVDMIYMIPTFEFEVEKKLFSKTYNEVPTGFEMQKNVHISFTDINMIDNMVTEAAKSEIYDLVKIDFFVDDAEAVNDTIINVSVDFLNKKLKTFGKLNFKLDDKYHISRDALHTIYPETQYSDYDAFVSQSIEAVKKKTGVTKIRKPNTVAYDQTAYYEFNIIINPAILQPVVQFMYILQVKYTLDKPVPEEDIKNNYILVTPNGDLKPIITE